MHTDLKVCDCRIEKLGFVGGLGECETSDDEVLKLAKKTMNEANKLKAGDRERINVLGDPSGADFENSSSLLGALVAEIRDEWGDEFRLESLDEIRGHDSFGHARAGKRSNRVGLDAQFCALDSERVGESDERKLHS